MFGVDPKKIKASFLVYETDMKFLGSTPIPEYVSLEERVRFLELENSVLRQFMARLKAAFE